MQLTVKYGGRASEIDVETYLTSLAAFTRTLDAVSQEVGSGQQLNITIKANQRGSFIVNLGLSPIELTDLFTTENLETVAKIVGTTASLLAIKKFLGRSKPESTKEHDDNVTVIGPGGSQISVEKYTFNIYSKNTDIQKSITTIFEAINKNRKVKSFELLDEDKKTIFEAGREDLPNMIAPPETLEALPNSEIARRTVLLNIVKIVFDSRRKWEFILDGRPISARIPEEFYKRCEAGEKFSWGDTLEVDLEITRVFNEQANTFVDDSYQIIKVKKHTPRNVNERLDI